MNNRDILNLYDAYVEIYDELDEAKKMKGEDPCWKGYEMVGTKKKSGREVPNCVPKEEVDYVDEEKKEFPRDKVRTQAAKHERNYLTRPNSAVGQRSKQKAKKMKAIASTVEVGDDPRNTMHGQDLRKIREKVDIYDIVLSHLLDEGYAETLEASEKIMVNMSEDWMNNILDEAKVDWHNRDQSNVTDRVRVLRDRNRRNAPGVPDGYQTAARRSRHETSRGKKQQKGIKPTSDNLGKMGRGPYRKQQFKRTGNDLYKD